MRTRLLRLWIVAPLALALLPALALAGRWQDGDNGYYTADLACRDGLRLSWVPFDQSGATLTTRIGAHHNTSGTAYDPNNILDAADYGPQLAAPAEFVAQSQPTPLAADTNNSGGVEPFELYTVYGSTTLRWTSELPVGAEVVIVYRQSFETTERGIGAATVADCRFAPATRSLPITTALLNPGPARLAPERQLYTVVQAPAQGGLRREGVPLPAGSSFTQADVDAGRVVYGYESEQVNETLRYRLSGLDRVSVAAERTGSNSEGRAPSVSADGRYVAFSSSATNLVDGDTNNFSDIFVRDMENGQIARVSVATGGAQGNGGSSFRPAITPDGRYVAFVSAASNLVPGDTNTCSAPFVTPNPVSYTSAGTCPDIFVHDRQTGATTRVSLKSDGSQSNGESFQLAITPDGRYVAFLSHGSTLVDGDTNLSTLCNAFTNVSNPAHRGSCPDAFVHDRQSGATTRVSLSDGEAQADRESLAVAISVDGRLVVFAAGATNLVAGDSNGVSDIFVRDTAAGTTIRLTAPGGTQPNGGSSQPALTPDGRFIAFVSEAGNLVAGDSNSCPGSSPTCADIFVLNRQSGQIVRASLGVGNAQASNESFAPAISDDGRLVLFGSYAPNLTSDDQNGRADVFVRDLTAGTTRLVSVSPVYGQSDKASGEQGLDLAGAGRYVVFAGEGASLVPGGTALVDVYSADLGVERTTQLSVPPPNTPPTLSTLNAQSVAQNSVLGPLAFTVGDNQSDPASLVVSVASSNETVLPQAGLALGGTGANRTLTITPASAPLAVPTSVTITLTVSDGVASTSSTFTVTVVPAAGGQRIYLPLLS